MDDKTEPQALVEEVIAGAVGHLRRSLEGEAVAALMHRMRNNLPVEYEKEWQAFAASYLLTNYRKSLGVLRSLPPLRLRSFMDVGCGTGSAALALLTLSVERGCCPEQITLLDREEQPLMFAACLSDRVAEVLGSNVAIDPVCSEALNYYPSGTLDFIVCSHVLSESNDAAASGLWNHLIECVGEGGMTLAVERASDQPWTRFNDSVSGWEVHRGEISVMAPAPQCGLSREWDTAWLLVRRPVAWMEALVQRYFEVWREQDPDALHEVFAPGALYSDKPFKEPMRGLEEITTYWKTEVVPQIRPNATPINVFYDFLGATIEWQADFDRQHVHVAMAGLMRFDFNPAQKRLDRVVEVYRTLKSIEE